MIMSVLQDPNGNRLWSTSSRQIMVFERDFNRKIEKSLTLSSLTDDAIQQQQDLKKPTSFPSHQLPTPDVPSCSRQPQNVDVDQMVSNIRPLVPPPPVPVAPPPCCPQVPQEQPQEPPKKPPRKRAPKSVFSGDLRNRNCLECGRPRSVAKDPNPGNLHYSYHVKGDPGMLYCPKKMNRLYGSPLSWTFEEFRASKFWAQAMSDQRKVVEEKKAKKEACAQRRAEMGWKKTGRPAFKKKKGQ